MQGVVNMVANIYLLMCLTNLHAGSGDVNFNIIDNEVQRDPISGYPVIHSSGVKGALREFYESKWGKKDTRIEYIFGSEQIEKGESTIDGKYKFLSASLISRPVRVLNGEKFFYRATSAALLKDFFSLLKDINADGCDKADKLLTKLEELKVPDDKVYILDNDTEVNIEGLLAEYKDIPEKQLITDILGKNIAIFSNNTLKALPLPVQARNRLGENNNLWYEEIVPRESIFYLSIIPGNDKENYISDFEGLLFKENIQFGADASIGYGLTEIRKLWGE
jgi:CRISPR-associated protein Cmr4